MAAGDGQTTARRGGLGRGLGALIPTGGGGSSGIAIDAILGDGNDHPQPVPGATFAQIPIEQITPNPRQPRQSFDDEMHAELKASIGAFGLLQPIVVRRLEADHYELVMGERRWRASRDLGLETIPAIVRDTADNAMLRDALLENLHRQQLNPLEEAAAYQQLLQEFDTTHDELAGRIGRSRSQVTNTIRLLNLPVAVQRRVAAGVLSAGHARALLSVDDVELQDELAARIVAEGLSVRAIEELVALGGRASRPGRRPRPSRITAPGLTDLGERLSDEFDTRVKVEFGRRKGRIVVEFASVDDLERIVAMMAPTVASEANGRGLSPAALAPDDPHLHASDPDDANPEDASVGDTAGRDDVYAPADLPDPPGAGTPVPATPAADPTTGSAPPAEFVHTEPEPATEAPSTDEPVVIDDTDQPATVEATADDDGGHNGEWQHHDGDGDEQSAAGSEPVHDPSYAGE